MFGRRDAAPAPCFSACVSSSLTLPFAWAAALSFMACSLEWLSQPKPPMANTHPHTVLGVNNSISPAGWTQWPRQQPLRQHCSHDGGAACDTTSNEALFGKQRPGAPTLAAHARAARLLVGRYGAMHSQAKPQPASKPRNAPGTACGAHSTSW